MTHRKRPVSPLGSAVDLPHMSPEEAYIVADIFDRISTAIWDAYGDDMLQIAAEHNWPDPPCRTRHPDNPDKPR